MTRAARAILSWARRRGSPRLHPPSPSGRRERGAAANGPYQAFNAAATDPYPVSIAVGPAGAWCSRVTVTGTATSRKQTARLTAL